ncbi:hypothetical protein ACJZ2D_002475 [Fusarium nematophilum]
MVGQFDQAVFEAPSASIEDGSLEKLVLLEDSITDADEPEKLHNGCTEIAQGLWVRAATLMQHDSGLLASFLWIAVNTLATVGIVFTNKAIFSDPALRRCQLTFASVHFSVTWLTLHLLSRPRFALFTRRQAPLGQLIPLAVAMCLNVILPNLSLAFSSVTFYQIARILLTPTVAGINFLLYKETLPRRAMFALVPACVGVGLVTYNDSLPAADEMAVSTSPLGVTFAFTGVIASALYTVWIASYHRKLQMTSMQLLYNQAPIASGSLLYAIPFLDALPAWAAVPVSSWLLIVLSAIFASLINISQFCIVGQTSPVSSTVVGHVKTCTIVTLGWALSGSDFNGISFFGIMISLGGIVLQTQKITEMCTSKFTKYLCNQCNATIGCRSEDFPCDVPLRSKDGYCENQHTPASETFVYVDKSRCSDCKAKVKSTREPKADEPKGKAKDE